MSNSNINTFTDYYEQEELWGKNPSPRQQMQIDGTLSLVPNDIRSILDVGCGDGKVTNRLSERFEFVVGADFSYNALKHVEGKRVLSKGSSLSFQERSFDLVITCQVLEHVLYNDYFNVLKELERVSKKYILVTVPNEQDLQRQFAKCSACGATFHPQRHLRAFSLEDLKSLFSDFKYIKHKYMGRKRRRAYKYDIFLRQQLGNSWSRTITNVCPQCGYKGFTQKRRRIILIFLNILRLILPRKRKYQGIGVLYARKQ